MKTSIIILTYNKLEYTKQCIESIRKYTEIGTYEIIMVDNNSLDGTVEWIKEQDDVIPILNNENLGFPKGCNQGIKVASGDNILLLNNDVIVTPRWLENLILCLYSSNEIAAVGPLTNFASYFQAINVEYRNLEELYQFSNEFNISDASKWQERLKLIGFCMLIKKDIINEIGLLDEQFTPGNFEDDDYSIRINKAGYKLMLCRDVFIHHYGSVSFKENDIKHDDYNKLLLLNMKKINQKYKFDLLRYLNINHDILTMINEPKEKKIKVLQLGCGGGGTLLEIRNMFPNSKLFGMEKDDNVLINTYRFADVKIGDFQSVNFNYWEEDYFDYIIMSESSDSSINIDILKKYEKYLYSDGKFIVYIADKNYISFYEKIKKQYKILNELTSVNQQVIKFGTYKDDRKEETSMHESEGIGRFFETIEKLDKGEVDIEEIKLFIEKLNENNLNELILFVEEKMNNKIQILNYIAVRLFEIKKYDLVLPLLQRCFEYDNSDYDTLINLSIVLETFGEYKLSLKYIEMIKQNNDEIDQIIMNLKNKINKGYKTTDIEQNDVVFTGERLVINSEVKNKYSDVLEEHIERYKLASQFVKDKVVLDAACGAGYGSKMLSNSGATQIFSVDISEECLENAQRSYSDEKIKFMQGDVNQLPFENNTFDVVVSFETIEHIKDGSKWIKESSRLLKDDGIFIVSTPNRTVTNPGTFFNEQPLNTYHQYEYNIQEFIGELIKEYDLIDIYGQTFLNDSEDYFTRVMREVRKLDANNKLSKISNEGHKLISLSKVKDANPMYVVAICRKKKVYDLSEDKSEKINAVNKDTPNFYYYGNNSYLGDGDIVGAEAISIGDNVMIKRDFWLNIALSNFNGEPRIVIEDGCQIGKNLTISIANRAIIGKNILMGSNVYIADCGHEYKDVSIPIMHQGVTATSNEVVIGENSWLGINSVIVGNVHIGKGCVIGANTFVNKDIPDYSVVAGNPGKIIKMFDTKSMEWLKVKSDDDINKILKNRKDTPFISI